MFQLVTRLIKRIYKGAVTVHDYLLAIAVPVLRKMLPKEGVAFLDQKCPKSMEALLDSLQQWWAITRGSIAEAKTVCLSTWAVWRSEMLQLREAGSPSF